VQTVDADMALKVYIKARATPKVIASFAEKGEFDKILIYSKQVRGHTDPSTPLIGREAHLDHYCLSSSTTMAVVEWSAAVLSCYLAGQPLWLPQWVTNQVEDFVEQPLSTT